MLDALLSGLVAGYGVAIPVGAIAPLIMSLTARTSLRVGAGAALGVAAADGIYAIVAVLGGAALAKWIEPMAQPLRWIAVAILVLIAVQTAYSAVRHYREPKVQRETPLLNTPVKAFGALLGLTILNPMTIVYFGALVLGRQSHDAAQEAVFCVAVFAASASWQLLIASGGALVGRVLTGIRGRLWTAIVSSVMIGALALGLAVAK